MARTEEEVVSKAPLIVTLGGDDYEIKPLVIRDSRQWRKKLIGLIAPLPVLLNLELDTDHPETFQGVLKRLMVTMPNQVLDLFFEYAKDLNRKEIEGKATDSEMAIAFDEVIKITFPLAQSLPKAMGRLSE